MNDLVILPAWLRAPAHGCPLKKTAGLIRVMQIDSGGVFDALDNEKRGEILAARRTFLNARATELAGVPPTRAKSRGAISSRTSSGGRNSKT